MSVEQEGPSNKLPDTVDLTPDGGNYYRAVTFWYAITAPSMFFVLAALLIAILNPFWFRDDFFRWVENNVNRFAKWRNYRQYAIYLGCDPEYWHTLKS